MANLNKLIVLSLIDLPGALNRIRDTERRNRTQEALKSELRAALDEGRVDHEKAEQQLAEVVQNHEAALGAVQKQEMELIKLRQKDAPTADLKIASDVLGPLKDALQRLEQQRKTLETQIAPLRETIMALSDKVAIAREYYYTEEPRTTRPETASEPPRPETKTAPKDSYRETPKAAEPSRSDTKTSDSKTTPKAEPAQPKAPRRPVYPSGPYNPFSMLDYITGKIQAEELLADINQNELKAYLAQRELEKMEEEAEISKRLDELKRRLSQQ